MNTEYMNDLPYTNETCTSIPQEVDRWVAKCIRCNFEFVNTHINPISYADADLYPNVHVIIKLLLTLPVGSCACERSFWPLRCLKTWCRATLTEDRLCWLAMFHVHHNDTVGQVNPEAVLKRWISNGNRKINLTFTNYLKLFIKILF